MDKQSAEGTMFTREEDRSSGNEKVADNQDECSIIIHQDSNSISHAISGNERQWLNSFNKSRVYPAIGSSEKPKIQMVPKMHREIESNIRCYEPLVVAIGPFHRGKSNLQLMEKYKELLAIQFADQERPGGTLTWLSTNSVSFDELYRKVKNIMPNVRECYAADMIKDYSNEEFAQMMFLDGCFILQYIHCIVTGNYRELKMKSHDIAFIRRDLFLLENQLPFEVLWVLMSCKFKKNVGMEMIKSFISSENVRPPQNHGFIRSIKDFFLDLFGENLFSVETKHEQSLHLEVPKSYTKQESSINQLPAHLLELSRRQLINPNAFSQVEYYRRDGWFQYRSVMELRRSGIHFRPGKSRRLSDIKFNSFCCSTLLTLPPIKVDDATKSELLNLVAYEACPGTPDDFGVTSYICFMDSLIDDVRDVKELRSKGILLNFLGSDQEVADLFNEMARHLVPNPHAFIDVRSKIEKHYDNRVKIWITEWMNIHFANPWSVLAFIAANFTIALQLIDTALSGIQTYYAVHKKDS